MYMACARLRGMFEDIPRKTAGHSHPANYHDNVDDDDDNDDIASRSCAFGASVPKKSLIRCENSKLGIPHTHTHTYAYFSCHRPRNALLLLSSSSSPPPTQDASLMRWLTTSRAGGISPHVSSVSKYYASLPQPVGVLRPRRMCCGSGG